MGKSKKTDKSKSKQTAGSSIADGATIDVDPARVRFQHSKIRPVFSGCGRSVEGTLEDIRQGKLKPSDLPPIQVIVGPTEGTGDEPWYFSLNNRRLWVLKRCRDEGLLPDNHISVRVRKPKSEQEAARYCLDNCALEAKIIPEKQRQRKEPGTLENEQVQDEESEEQKLSSGRETSSQPTNTLQAAEATNDSDDESSDDGPIGPVSNRFSALGF
eukprot:TRINITY_DN23007_c0_g1_i1.p1 TRINITY_DN23007_c0_g1~~TRINITY_DN23007_c0_g1_i1.p1  ORF type:complete len:214 (-),score=16.86 TRINITY_DN23007_c0_g1_i1:267-908(-)